MPKGKRVDRDEVLRLFRECKTLDEIAVLVGASKYTVSNIVHEMMSQTERAEINAKVRKKVNADYYRTSPHVAQDAPLPSTWAGAFRALALWCRDNGCDGAWQYARKVAMGKGMRL
jgi:hypothetical protein